MSLLPSPQRVKPGRSRGEAGEKAGSTAEVGTTGSSKNAILGPTWPMQANLEASMASKLLSSSLQAHSKTSKQPFCSLSESFLSPDIGQKYCFSLGFSMFLTFQLLATLHPQSKPTKPKICFKMASWTPREGPRRAKDSPRWAQEGLKMAPKWHHTGLEEPMITPRWHNKPKDGPSWPQNGLKMAQDGPKMASYWPRDGPS